MLGVQQFSRKTLCRLGIAIRGQQKIQRPTVFIDREVELYPLTLHLHLQTGLVDTPRVSGHKMRPLEGIRFAHLYHMPTLLHRTQKADPPTLYEATSALVRVKMDHYQLV